jgi:hypothetical protein
MFWQHFFGIVKISGLSNVIDQDVCDEFETKVVTVSDEVDVETPPTPCKYKSKPIVTTNSF